jgi:Spy/CpxP family protein refolding chaperone
MKTQGKPKDGTKDHDSKGRAKIDGLSTGTLDYLRPFYLGTQSGPQKSRYVLWVDIMGSQGKMLRNVETASIPLMKLHVAALKAKKKTIGDIDLFPVIDGIYVVSEYFSAIVFFISDVFRSMGAEFLVLKNWERSVIRGAVAYGPVIVGAECKEGAAILKESDYANSILLGMPLVQAYTAEKGTPPFGVSVHESVRAFGRLGKKHITVSLWRWWSKNPENMKIASALLLSLHSYYEWCRKNPTASGYPPERIDAHRAIADEYFGEFANGSLPSPATIAKSSKTKVQPTKDSKRDAGPHLDQQVAKLRKILNLSDEQVENIKPIIDAREAKVMEVTKNRSLGAEVRRLAINDLMTESKAKIQQFLTDEQKTVLVEREQVHNAGKKA